MEVKGGSSATARPAGGDCSSSGTLSSTYSPGGSPQYSADSGCGGLHLPGMFSAVERARKLGHVKGLVEEFSNVAAGAALERWFSELGVGWLLGLAPSSSSSSSSGSSRPMVLMISRQPQHAARGWILALREIKESIFTYLLDGLSREDTSTSPQQPGVSEFARFVEAALSKMLPFVDAIVALDANDRRVEKLQVLIDVRDALSTASEEVQFLPYSSSLCHANITDDMSDLLSSKLGTLDKVIWDTTDDIRTGVTASADDSLADQGIHALTRSVVSYIQLLDTNHVLMSRIVYEAAQLRGLYVPEIRNIGPLNSLITETFSCLEEKLVSMSQQDHSSAGRTLGLIFLINNSYFIWQQLHPMFGMEFPMAILNRKIDDYIQVYLQESWGPVVSRLSYDPRRSLRFGRYSPLPHFESEFQKTYDAQKLWKVPDPELRTRLRDAVVRKIIPGFKRFVEDNNVTCSPRVLTPQKLEEMLQDLFEG